MKHSLPLLLFVLAVPACQRSGDPAAVAAEFAALGAAEPVTGAAEHYLEACTTLRRDLVDAAGEPLATPEDGDDLASEAWAPLLAPSREAVQRFSRAAAMQECSFGHEADGSCRMQANLMALGDLAVLVATHAAHGELDPVDAAETQLRFAGHVAEVGSPIAGWFSAAVRERSFDALRAAVEAAPGDAELVARVREILGGLETRTRAAWASAWQESLVDEALRGLASSMAGREAELEGAFLAELRAELDRAAAALYGPVAGAATPAQVSARYRATVDAQKRELGGATSGEILRASSSGAVIAKTLALLLAQDPGELLARIERAEVSREALVRALGG